MTAHRAIEAVFEDGVFRPLVEVDLPEDRQVSIVVTALDDLAPELLAEAAEGFAQPRIKTSLREIEGVPSLEAGGYTQMSASGMVRPGNRAGEKSDAPIARAARR
ncbi:MAG: antitoxin family protein [candidate division NC10 bacterium]|nr:antitoxin family protein [candidate division NC10 bacterium]